jgi:DNA processing protein
MEPVMDEASTRAFALLASCPSQSVERLRPALERAGSAAALLAHVAAGADELLPATRRELAAVLPRAEAWCRWLAAGSGRHLLPFTDTRYPAQLRECPAAPVALWVEGDAAALAACQVALVGSRRPTPGGREIAAEWAGTFVSSGLIVTSGFAAGIDAAAHRGALAAGGRTIAVCATGLDRCYPAAHAYLAREIAAAGALVSCFPPGAPPRPASFHRRNRLLAALAVATVVVEAADGSGSLITARYAQALERTLFAVPGSIRNPAARGCHALLRQGARLATSAADVLAGLGLAPAARPAQTTRAGREYGKYARPALSPRLDKAGEILLDALGFEPVDVDTLVTRTGLPAQAVSSMLLILELQGWVVPHAGRYCRLVPAASEGRAT